MNQATGLQLVSDAVFPGIGKLAPPERAIFDALQDRHIPVTPRLVHGLQQLRTSSEPAAVPLWGRGFQLAGEVLGLTSRFGRTAYWAELSDVFLRVVAEPLLRRAASNTGRMLIGTHDPSGSVAQRDLATDFCQRLEAEVSRLLSDTQRMPRGFWSHAGTSLLQAYRARTSRALSPEAAGTARVMPLLAELVYEVEPKLPQNCNWQRDKRTSSVRAARDRSGLRPRAGGVTGVIHTRRVEDIDAALSTTFAYPPELLLPRIMEEGFMITHRPPKRRPKRDLLVMVLNDSSLAAGPAALVKAAWIDAATRLALILAEFNRTKVEMGWTDLHASGSAPAALSLEAVLPGNVFDTKGTAAAEALSGSSRCGMISASTLVPTAFDALPRLHFPRPFTAKDPAAPYRHAMQGLLTECFRAANGIQTATSSKRGVESQQRRETKSTQAREASDYAGLLLFHIGDAQTFEGTRVIDWTRDRAEIIQRCGLRLSTPFRAAEVLLPAVPGPEQPIRAASDSAEETLDFAFETEQPADASVAEMIGTLSNWIIEETIQAIHVN